MQYDRPLGVALVLECVKTALHTTRNCGQQSQVSPYMVQSTISLLSVYYQSTLSLLLL